MGKKFAGGVGFRAGEDTDTLLSIEARHGYPPGKFAELLTRAACEFYRAHGWFSFPVRIEPVEFQRRYVAPEPRDLAVAEPPSPTGGAGSDPVDEAIGRELERRKKRPRGGRRRRGTGAGAGASRAGSD